MCARCGGGRCVSGVEEVGVCVPGATLGCRGLCALTIKCIGVVAPFTGLSQMVQES